MRRNLKSLRTLIAAVAVFAFLFAGCVPQSGEGDGDGDGPTDATTDTSSSDTVADTSSSDTGEPGGDAGSDAGDAGSDGTDDTGSDATPTMSDKIAYVDGDHIYVANAEDGSGAMQLTQQRQNREPAWSPDGDTIVYKTRTDAASEWELWTIGSDGTGAQKLFADSTISSISSPDWSPDGSQIVFRGDHPDGDSYDIVTIDADGTNPTAVVSSDANESSPVWSPDGASIVYKWTSSGNFELRKVPASGGSPTTLASFNTLLRGNSAFTPSGDKIVFELGDQEADLYSINADGSGQTQITSNNNLNYGPSISGDGQTIAYYHFSYGSNERGIWTVDISGGTPQEFIDGGDQPAYSP